MFMVTFRLSQSIWKFTKSRAILDMRASVLCWQGFSLMKFCKCQNLNSLFREIIFLELPKYSWNVQMLSIIEKFKDWKVLLKNSWKIGMHFGRRSWKIGLFWTYWHIKLNNWHTFGTLARLLTRWHVKNEKLARVWHFGTLAHLALAHMAHMACNLANSYMLCESVNVNLQTTINFYDMTTLPYLVIKEKFE